MSTKVSNTSKTILLDTVSLLQATIPEEVPAPTFAPPALLKGTVSYASESESEYTPAPETVKAISRVLHLPEDERFSTFNSHHQELASYLIDLFYKLPLANLDKEVQCVLSKVNNSLVKYALSVALIHRKDANEANIYLPSHVTTEPGLYFDMKEITRNCLSKPKQNFFTDFDQTKKVHKKYVTMIKNFTGTNKDPEHKVAYFREDIGISLHHRHWHEVYPTDANELIVKKDRRGELFYYMHEQMLARYNFERLCQGLPFVEPFEDFREPIKEAYFPKMQQMSPNSAFPGRPANSVLKDIRRDDMNIKIATMEAWRDRIFETISRGYAYVVDKNTKMEVLKKIEESTGIEELVNTVEASRLLSWNFQYYGNLHNFGHVLIANVHDPDDRYNERTGIMGYTETNASDPVFYRWHAFIDSIFQCYKETLPPYTLQMRQFNGITIESVNILPQKQQSNVFVLNTFRQNDIVNVTKGLLNIDSNKEEIYAIFQHSQHEDFEYEIKVKSDLKEDVTGTVRIFMAPHFDDAGLEMSFNNQRKLFIELDKFTAQVYKGKTTTIKRKSTESSVTIPFEQSFLTLNDAKELTKIDGDSYCSCGWPHHLLIGRGTVGEGLLCDLFVMITNYKDDQVDGVSLEQKCCKKSSLSYCGVRDKKYPDKKPMGFPFDRNISDAQSTLHDFMTVEQEHQSSSPALSNMKVVKVRVKHDNGPAKCGPSITNPELKKRVCPYEDFHSLK